MRRVLFKGIVRGQRRRWLQPTITILALGLAALGSRRALAQQCQSQAVEVGYRDFNYGTGVTAKATAEKPESKLWWNDGYWWGSLADPGTDTFRIHRFDLANQCWDNVGPTIDDRSESSADALWDGQKLYIASHESTTRLYRFSYNFGTQAYSLDANFPVEVNDTSSEALTLAKDSTGQLWVSWTEGGQVMVNRSLGDDLTWGTPFALPVAGSSASSDDISAITPHGGNKIGVLWSNQGDQKIYFAVHEDAKGDSDWEPTEIALSGSGAVADDHVNLSVTCNSDGSSVVAATKSSLGGATDPKIYLLVRGSGGNWSNHTVALDQDDHTRPIVLCETNSDSVHVIIRSKKNGRSRIYKKSSILSNPEFEPGVGDFFIDSSSDPEVNDPTSTKQTVSATTGLLVLASDDATHNYLHNYMPIEDSGPALPPTISSFTPASGAVGTEVTILGQYLSGTNSVSFNNIAGNFTIDSDSQVLAEVPAGATSGKIRATTSAGTGVSTQDFTVILPPGPTISGFNPGGGLEGSEVTIAGSGFTGTSVVAFNGLAAGFIEDSDVQVRAFVPSGTTTGPISLTSATGVATSASNFIVSQGETPTNFTIAFIGDQGLDSTAKAVLALIKDEGSDAVVHSGDFDYLDNPPAWNAQIDSILGTNFPYFASIGNHDTNAFYGPGGYQEHLEARMSSLGISWDGDLGVQSSFKYNGMFFLLTDPRPSNADSAYIRDKLAANSSKWRISSWHENMRLMQVGSKDDATGWGAYEESRRGGAIVATGHSHTYSRTHLMSSFQDTTVASTSDTLVLTSDQPGTPADEGKGFVFVSGIAGKSIRSQILGGYWWDSIYTKTQNANYGALFGVFNYNGVPNLARFYFKNIDGVVIDSFYVESNIGEQFNLATNTNGSGSVTLNPAGGSYPESTEVTLTATPQAGWQFTGWSGDITGSQNPATTVMNGNKNVTATFTTMAPVISSFTPTNGSAGTEVTVSGANFSAVSGVSFGASSAIFVLDSDSQLRANVPAGAVTGKISVTNAFGTATSSNDFVVTLPPVTVSFSPTQDAHVKLSRPTRNYGSENSLKVRESTSSYHSYLKFSVTGLNGLVQNAKVRLVVTDDGPDGGSIYRVSNDFLGTTSPWDEDSLIWNNAPAIGGTVLSSTGAVSDGDTVDFDVTSVIAGDGTYSFGIQSQSEDRMAYSSKEGSSPPQLMIEFSSTPPPVPSISSFAPTNGQVGTEVTISGANLAGASVSFNGLAGNNVTVDSDTQVRAAVPTGAASGPISVATAGGTAASSENFAVIPPPLPVISGFTPASGQVGTEVTISGSNFTGASVAFSGTPATNVTVDNDNQVRAAVPTGAATGKITVTTPGGLATSSGDFAVTLPPPPPISGFSPTSGPPGTEVTVSGSSFIGATAVSFGGTAATSYTIDSDSQLRATVAGGSVTGVISVTTSSGSGSSSTAFAVTTPPSIVTFTPTDDAYVKKSSPTKNYGSKSSLKIRESGSAYHGYLKFTVSGLGGLVQSAKVRLVVADAGPDGGSIYLVSNDYQGTSTPWVEGGLEFNNAPLISGSALSSTGAVSDGDTVEFDVAGVIAGDGTYSFGIQSGSPERMAYSSKEGNSPPELIIETSTTPPPVPSISGFSPTTGPAGTEVTISGSSLTGASVSFNGTAATVTVDGDTQVRADVPTGATTGPIMATTLGGSATSASDFTVTLPAAPTIADFTPTSGTLGTEVTVTGANFIAVSEVGFNGTVASYTVDSDSQLRATVPSGATTGTIRVMAEGGMVESGTDFDVIASPSTLTFAPTDDSFGKSSSPTKNYGDDEELRVRKSSRVEQTYLKFNVTGVVGSVVSAKVRLLVTSGSDDGGSIFLVSNDYQGASTPWTEGGLFWNNAPVISGGALSSLGVVDKEDTVEFDVTAAISGDGIYSFGIANNSSDAVKFHSKESGVHIPELVMQTSGSLSKVSTLAREPTERGRARVSSSMPEELVLGTNYPNPFNLETTIEYALPRNGHVRMIIYNVLGRRTRVLIDGVQAAGYRKVSWDGRGDNGKEIASGIYLIQLQMGNKELTRKMTLVK